MKTETVESRAVTIAAKVLQAAGVCRYDDFNKCRRVYVDETVCDKCIRSWLIAKAKSELKKENVKKTVTVPPLRACPLCGGKATINVLYSDGLYYAQARCESCHAISSVCENKGRINAVRAAALRWNKYVVKDGVGYENWID